MNIVRANPRLGQFDPTGQTGFLPSQPQDALPDAIDTFPMYYDPGLILAEQGGAPAPSTSVPKPPTSIFDPTGQTGFLPSQMNITPVASAQIPAPGAISPAPHVNIPVTSAFQSFQSAMGNLPSWAVIAIGTGLFIALMGPVTGRRRR